MKSNLKRFRRLGWLAGVACGIAIVSGPGYSTAQESEVQGQLESMQVQFPVQRIGSSQKLPAVDFPEARSHGQQVLQTAATGFDPNVAKLSRRLTNLGWEQFEHKLVDLWGDRIQAEAEDEQGSRVRILIPSDQNGNNQMIIDRNNNAVTFEGDPLVAENWVALIDHLDRDASNQNKSVRLVGLGNATPATIRRTVGLLGIPEDDSPSLTEALKFTPFRSSANVLTPPQRRSQLRSIPFRPKSNANKNASAANIGPRERREPTTATANLASPKVKLEDPSNGIIPRNEDELTAPARSTNTRKTNTPPRFQPKNSQSTQGIPSSARARSATKTSIPNESSPRAVTSQGQTTPAIPMSQPPVRPVSQQQVQTRSTVPVQNAIHSTTRPKTTRNITYSAPNPTQQEEGQPQQEQQPEGQENQLQVFTMPDDTLDGTVKIRVVPELNAIFLIGDPADVAKVKAMIENIVSTAGASQPVSRLYPVKNADSATLKTTIDQVYESAYASNNGSAEIIAINPPNSLMVVAQEPAQKIIEELINKLDIETPDTDETMDFEIFRLKHMSAVDAGSRLQGYFRESATGGNQTAQEVQPGNWIAAFEGLVSIIVDYRSNSVIVKGNQRVLKNAKRIISELDVDETGIAHDVRFFTVYNALATDVATVLQATINGQLEGAPTVFAPSQNQGLQAQAAQTAGFGTQARANLPVPMLKMTTIDENGKLTKSGILLDVKVVADANSNQIMVTGPEKSMDLIGALIRQLDRIPDAETQIKVFTILNGDANELLVTLQNIFGQDQNQFQGGGLGGGATTGQLSLQTASTTEGASLINLRFGVDSRTNSIIASGPAGDLQVIEDLLNRLDERDLSNRINHIYRLSNAPAEDVAFAINEWLTGRQEVFDSDPTSDDPFVSARRQVVVVQELVSNSLIISANPAYFEEVIRLIEDLDERPPMIKIKVLLAEVALDKISEFGVEVGIQDSLLFDRGLGIIGFPFNQSLLGNNADNISLATREILAGQALSQLGVGRSNSTLGYGGLVLTAGNESINVLMRALQDRGVARVLATPDIMTVDNLQGRIQVGQKVPRITGASQNDSGGTTTNVVDTDVGVILAVTPRVSPDGMIIMNVDAVSSQLGSEEDGVPVFVSEGQVVRSPPIDITQAQTTIMARSGQTVAFSGLIRDATVETRRGTPILSDLPVIGPLFSFERDIHARTELLIILTPYLVDSQAQLEASNHAAMSRLNWCKDDVARVYGPTGYGEFDSENVSQGVPAYFPDEDPTGQNPKYLPLENRGAPTSPNGQFPNDVFEQPTVPSRVPAPQQAPSPSDGSRGVGLLKRILPGNSSVAKGN